MPQYLYELLRICGLLTLATVLGLFVGLEREKQNRPAGLRTHALVSLGSALITIISVSAFNQYGSDPFRLAAQIVSGIGFLGAGTILREGVNIKGLTTAASLWATAGIGIAVGSNMLILAVSGTLLITIVLIPLGKLERSSYPLIRVNVKVVATNREDILKEVLESITSCGSNILKSEVSQVDDTVVMELGISRGKDKAYHLKMIQDLQNISGVKSVMYEDS